MTQLRIPKGKPKVNDGIVNDILDNTFIIKVEILDIIEKPCQSSKKVMLYY
jgi:hypothetical protein